MTALPHGEPRQANWLEATRPLRDTNFEKSAGAQRSPNKHGCDALELEAYRLITILFRFFQSSSIWPKAARSKVPPLSSPQAYPGNCLFFSHWVQRSQRSSTSVELHLYPPTTMHASRAALFNGGCQPQQPPRDAPDVCKYLNLI